MQVSISFTLNLTKTMPCKELQARLIRECPMEVTKDAPFKVSTEQWDIVEVTEEENNAKSSNVRQPDRS